MKTEREEQLKNLLDTVGKELAKSCSGSDLDTHQRFAARFLGRVNLEVFQEMEPYRLSRLLQDGVSFIRERSTALPTVRVFNPRQDVHGWDSQFTVVEIINDDMPFLVDSVSIAVADHDPDCLLHLIVHPLLHVDRDAGGNLMKLHPDDSAGKAESYMMLLISKQTDVSVLKALQQTLEQALDDVRVAVEDWSLMKQRVDGLAEKLPSEPSVFPQKEMRESSLFLRWLVEDHFTFLGYRDYRIEKIENEVVLRPVLESGLGLLRGDRRPSRQLLLSEDELDLRDKINEPLILTKTNSRSTVHRQGYMDYIGVLQYDDQGNLQGERRILGLYTSSAWYRRPWNIPLVRRMVESVVERSGYRPGSHGAKELMHILETLPREELFQSNVEELYRLSKGVKDLSHRQQTRLFIRRDRFGRFYSCLAYIPRDRFNTDNRLRIQNILMEALGGERVDFNVQLGEMRLARLHLVIRPRNLAERALDVDELEARMRAAVRDWQDELQEILVEKTGEERGLRLARKIGCALPASYREDVSPWVAAFDVENAAELVDPDDMRMSLYRPRRKRVGIYRFKIFRYDNTIPLSDVLPMLENMGLRVVSERPYEVKLDPSLKLWIQDFDILPQVGSEGDLEDIRDEFQTAFEKVVRGVMENDGFNALILAARLDWRKVVLLRAYCKYLLQTGVPFSQVYMQQTLKKYPHITYLLVEYFSVLLDPVRQRETRKDREAAQHYLHGVFDVFVTQNMGGEIPAWLDRLLESRAEDIETQQSALQHALLNGLEMVASQDEDRILRGFMDTMNATLRTNFYQYTAEAGPAEHVAFKLDSGKVPDLPKPRPKFEIFVYSPRVEGIHLRGGMVARGGLRWSDRREDFRTEVLGLMKAQQVKNTMIVPVGAKGGFVVKRMPDATRDEQMREVVHCYRSFISGLLEISDNLIDGEIKPPENVHRRDGDDPYLVVAADKGTATFSDIANSVALDKGFWLGDAFASGGSVGYDHKKMGITAKGGWESVKRHFRELGINCQKETFTCVGIGDMAGDVFGNGMLLSKTMKLVAAFNHQHIFIDPDPDPARSWKERKRLFDTPGTRWSDYNAKLISAGGGVFSRNEKHIQLSDEAREVLGIEESKLSPQALIRAILAAPVDLLWNGGIGTYVKASSESHQDVGDRANDGLRINGSQLRCKVVGEGGNLGLTQLGRIEYALAGGRLNTDFIDNSAGVDCSDHEVNIKILLNEAMKNGRLESSERDDLLMAMTDEVGELVLRNNYLQTQSLTMMEALSTERLGAKAHLISVLEQAGELDRQLEFLPTPDELQERKTRGQSLTRPELSILLSYAKITLNRELIQSDVPEDPYLASELERYFPDRLGERFLDEMQQHRLRREIIATMVTNSIVNRMGATFRLRMQEDAAASPAEIAKAYTVAREVLDARDLWAKIEGLDNKLDSKVQTELNLEIWNLLRHLTRWILNQHRQELDITCLLDRYREGVRQLWSVLPKSLDEVSRQLYKQQHGQLKEKGVPSELAARMALLSAMYSCLDIVRATAESTREISDVAKLYFGLGHDLYLHWLREQIEGLTVEGQWHANARSALRDELYQHHLEITVGLLRDVTEDQPVLKMLENWLQEHQAELKHLQTMLGDMRTSSQVDYAMVSVALRGIKQIASLCS